jgi:hypothetical protein
VWRLGGWGLIYDSVLAGTLVLSISVWHDSGHKEWWDVERKRRLDYRLLDVDEVRKQLHQLQETLREAGTDVSLTETEKALRMDASSSLQERCEQHNQALTAISGVWRYRARRDILARIADCEREISENSGALSRLETRQTLLRKRLSELEVKVKRTQRQLDELTQWEWCYLDVEASEEVNPNVPRGKGKRFVCRWVAKVATPDREYRGPASEQWVEDRTDSSDPNPHGRARMRDQLLGLLAREDWEYAPDPGGSWYAHFAECLRRPIP